MEEKIIEIDNIKAYLNYEQLLCRAIDRVLFNRTTRNTMEYTLSVKALYLSLVDLPSKPLRTEMEKIVNDMGFKWEKEGLANDSIERYDAVLQHITKTLADHKMLFKSTPIEVNR